MGVGVGTAVAVGGTGVAVGWAVGSGVAVAAGCVGVAVGVFTGCCVGFAALGSAVGAVVAVRVGSTTGSGVAAGAAVGIAVGDGGVGVFTCAATGAAVATAAGAKVGAGALVAGCAVDALPPQARMAMADSASAVVIIARMSLSSIFLNAFYSCRLRLAFHSVEFRFRWFCGVTTLDSCFRRNDERKMTTRMETLLFNRRPLLFPVG